MDITSRYVSYLQLLFIFVGIIMVVLPGIIIIDTTSVITQGTLTDDWQETSGLVIAFITESVDDDGDLRYRPHNYYIYEVDDTTYRGYQVSVDIEFRNWSTTVESVAIARLRGYENNTQVPVFYDPQQPSQAVLEKGVPQSSYPMIKTNLVWFIGGTILITTATLISVFGLFARRRVINKVRSSTIPIQTQAKEEETTFSLHQGHFLRQLGQIIGMTSSKPRSIFGYSSSVLIMAFLAMMTSSTFFFGGLLSDYFWLFFIFPVALMIVGEYLFSMYYSGAPIMLDNQKSSTSTTRYMNTFLLQPIYVILRYMVYFVIFLLGYLVPFFAVLSFAIFVIFIGLIVFQLYYNLLDTFGYELNTPIEILNTMLCGFVGPCYVQTDFVTPGTRIVLILLPITILLVGLVLFGLFFTYYNTNKRYTMHINTGIDLYSNIILSDKLPLVGGIADPTGKTIIYSSGNELWNFDLIRYRTRRLGTTTATIHKLLFAQDDILTATGSKIERWSSALSYQPHTLYSGNSQISAVAIDSAGNLLLVGTVSGELYQLEIQSGELVETFTAMTDRVQILIPVEDKVYAVSKSGQIVEISQGNATELRTKEQAKLTIMSGNYHDGKLLLGSHNQGLWSLQINTGEPTQLNEIKNPITSCAVIDDRIYLGLDNGKLLEQHKTQQEPFEYVIHAGPIISIQKSGDHIITSSLLGSIKLSQPEDIAKQEMVS